MIGSLVHLTYLKLNHNSFVGSIPTHIENLTRLVLLHLHSNRLKGNITLTGLQQGYDESSFITDCGSPARYNPINCTGCTICCEFLCVSAWCFLAAPCLLISLILFFTGNTDGKCQPDEKPKLLQARAAGFETFASFCYVLLASVFGLSCVLALVSHVLDATNASERYGEDASTRNLNNMSTESISRSTEQLAFEADEKYAMKQMLGEGSVYGFFLTDSRVAWAIALVTIALQILMVRLLMTCMHVQ